jgi:hypothetical protein
MTDRNWYAGLGLALTLPDICGFMESPDLKSMRRYVSWCDKYLVPKYTRLIGADDTVVRFLGGQDCYALRCAFLHEGVDDVVRQRAHEALESFTFVVPNRAGISVHCNRFNGTLLQLQVDRFCEDLCNGVDEWMGAVAGNLGVQQRLSELMLVRDALTGSPI